MSTGIQKKIRSFLGIRDDLLKKYLEVHQTHMKPDLRQSLTDLYELDQLCYYYYALQSYYDLSKARWDLDYRNLLDDLSSLQTRIEDKIPVSELCNEIPELKVLRREFRENAKEGGKVAFLIISLSVDTLVLKDIVSLGLATTLPRAKTITPMESSKEQESPKVAESEKVVSATSNHLNVFSDYNTSQANLRSVSQPYQRLQGAPLPQPPQFPGPAQSSQATSIQNHQIPRAASVANAQVPRAVNEPNVQVSKATNIPSVHRSGIAQSLSFPVPVPALARPNEVTSTSKRPSLSPVSEMKRTKTTDGLEFQEFRTWTREHNLCIFRAVISNAQRTGAIQKALLDQFGVNISPQAAATLELHYGYSPRTMDYYQYYNQTFQLVASQFFENQNYVIVPWADMRLQFARKTKLILEDWEVRGRFLLFLLHRRVYGKSGEPPSNYSDLVEEWKKLVAIRNKLSSNTSQPTIQGPAGLDFQSRSTSISVDEEEQSWTPKTLSALIEAHSHLPKGIPNRMMAVKHFIKLRSGKDIDVMEIERRLKWRDVEIGVANSLREQADIRSKVGEKAKNTEGAQAKNNEQSREQSQQQTEKHNQQQPQLPNQQHSQVPSQQIQRYAQLQYQRSNQMVPSAFTEMSPSLKAYLQRKDVVGSSSAYGETTENNGIGAVKRTTNSTEKSDITTGTLIVLDDDASPDPITTGTTAIVPAPNSETSTAANTAAIATNIANTTSATAAATSSIVAKPAGITPDTTIAEDATTKYSSPKSSTLDGPSQFNRLLADIERWSKPDWYYESKFNPSVITKFWDFEKCKCVYSTVEYFANIPADTPDLTLRVARSGLKKMTQLRLLRGFKIKVLESLVENKLMNMMELDIFSPEMVEVTKNAL